MGGQDEGAERRHRQRAVDSQANRRQLIDGAAYMHGDGRRGGYAPAVVGCLRGQAVSADGGIFPGKDIGRGAVGGGAGHALAEPDTVGEELDPLQTAVGIGRLRREGERGGLRQPVAVLQLVEINAGRLIDADGHGLARGGGAQVVHGDGGEGVAAGGVSRTLPGATSETGVAARLAVGSGKEKSVLVGRCSMGGRGN